jgi:hypothetical protein
MISPHPSPASGKGSRPRRIHVSPEGPLKQRTHPRLARGPARAGFAEKQPWPDRHANRLYRRSIQCKDRLTPYPDARSSVDRAEVTVVTSPLHWPTWQEKSVVCPALTVVPLDRVRLTAAKSSLGRHRKLHLARPQGSGSNSTPDDGLRLARPQGSDSASTMDDGLRLARPSGPDSTSTSTSEEPPPRSTSGSDRPRHRGAIITLPLASSGYGEQDQRPIWLTPVNK